jgi:hypothetical protein
VSSRHLLIVAVVGLFSTAQAGTIYVDDDNCPGPGSGSPGDPYCSIQTAIDNAVDTDEIIVAPGTYNETINLLGKAVWLHSSHGPDVTIVDAQQSGTVVTCDSGEGPATVLEGFTLTGGTGTWFEVWPGWPYRFIGGGMFNNASSPTVTECTFTDNWAEDDGGGMYSWNSSPTLTDCKFEGNTAGSSGGGMFNWLSSPTLTNCKFEGNTAGSAGGGMYNFGIGSSPTVTDCTFAGNTPNRICHFQFCNYWAGGMANFGGSPSVTNCTFSDNEGVRGGGMSNEGSSPTVTDCTFSANIAEVYGNQGGVGGGMWNGSSSPTVTDCRFMHNWAEINGGGMLNVYGNPTITNSLYCENTPNDIWGDWDGDDNTFSMLCPPFYPDAVADWWDGIPNPPDAHR